MDEHGQAQAWVAAAMRRAMDELAARAVVGYAGYTSAATTETASISLADLERVRRELLAKMGNVPRAIWFVDRPGELAQVVEELEPSMVREFTLRGRPPGLDAWIGTLYGVPVCEWTRTTATAEERKRAPWFVDVPGVWAEMSDGRHQRIG